MRLNITPLQVQIWNLLTDEPQTASEIASKLGLSSRTVASSLVWMRSNWLADDGSGFRAYENGACIFNKPRAAWKRDTGAEQWVKCISCPVFPRKTGVAS